MKIAEGLLRGINLGGWLSQCSEYTQQHYTEFITEKDIERIASWGFDHVRLPVDYNVIENDKGEPDEEGYAHVKRCADWCGKHGLHMIIDLHKAAGFSFDAKNSDNILFDTPELCDRFLALWKNISSRFGDNKNIAFELLNEISDRDSAVWSSLASKAIAVIREHSENRIIVGGTLWNSVHTLKNLDIPIDGGTVFTFHFYEPFLFTHQRACWQPVIPDKPMSYRGNIEDYRRRSEEIKCFGSGLRDVDEMGPVFMEKLIYEAVCAARDKEVPLYCGEYGVIDNADIDDTVIWFDDVKQVFDKYGIGHAVWTYKSMSFGVTDEHYAPAMEKIIDII